MQIKLDSDVEETITRLVAKGKYESPVEAVNQVLRLVLDRPHLRQQYDELKEMIREGIESAERGELRDADEVFDEILRDLEQAQAQTK